MVVVVGACAGSRSLQPAQIDTASYTAICVCASTSSTQESVNAKKRQFYFQSQAESQVCGTGGGTRGEQKGPTPPERAENEPSFP